MITGPSQEAGIEKQPNEYQPPNLYVIGPVTDFTFGSDLLALEGGVLKGRILSDARIKQAVTPIENAVAKLREL